ncbi:IS110 family transposase [Bernardetia sp.]|uniref:IS110 family transposase n=1 Tax=Bernardetia sp. TaxID=1937974 RepID=UPI0025BFFBCA|nr:IS110 family transposase [Bernardetia sp.]
MLNYKYFVGVDVSKSTLDIALYQGQHYLSHHQIKNEVSSIETYFANLSSTYSDFTPSQVLLCLENTGRYMNFLLSSLSSQSYCIWIENAYSIKHSLGLRRGKNDKVDAMRIGEYASRFSDKALLYKASSLSVRKLKAMQSVRSQLVESRKRLLTDLKEAQKYDQKELYHIKKKATYRTLKALDKDIESVEKQLEQVIKEDTQLTRIMKILCSIPGIKKVTSIALIIVTEAFTKFESAKQLACYCGVVPFENRSGTSLRKKSSVSKKSDRKMKALLTLCARSITRTKGELNDYYQRKLKEGKEKMVILNAIQNKLILRAFALVRDNRMYENKYQNKVA